MTQNDRIWHGNTGGLKHISRVSHVLNPRAVPQRPQNFWDPTYAKTF